MHWPKITLIGVGLLGGSLGLAIKRQRLADKVDGFVRRSATIAECNKIGAVDHATRDLRRAVENADLVVLCTPIAQMRNLTEQMLPSLKRHAIVTDVGSVKASVVHELESLVAKAGAHFVGSHPMAGAERMGVRNARADLFDGAICVVTPTPHTSTETVKRVEAFWKAVGANPIRLSPKTHDDLVSRSSHLPHVVAAELANYVLSPAHPKEQALLCANGARFITDDLLRLQPDGKDFCCFTGTGQIRLRKGAAVLAENFPATAHETTPDGRIAVTMDGNQSMVPLGAIVIPRLSRHDKELKLQRIPRSMSLLYLMAFPRIQGLQQEKHLQRRLDSFGRIAANIPIFKAEIPWGLPFPHDLAHSLVRGVEAHLHGDRLLMA